LDARGRAPFFLITADVYAQGELVEAENLRQVDVVVVCPAVPTLG
jgi:hypothetical protein